MRSPAARLITSAVAWVALGAAGFFLFTTEKQLTAARAADRAFDLRARETTDALADLRVAEHAYVAAGQGIDFWMPKVSATAETATQSIAALGSTATSAATRQALDEAAAAMAEFKAVDQRAREYMKAGQQLMAGDVVFTEGGETAVQAARHVEQARLAEHQAVDELQAQRRKQEIEALGAAAAIAALALVLLIPGARVRDTSTSTLGLTQPEPASTTPPHGDELLLRHNAPAAPDAGRAQKGPASVARREEPHRSAEAERVSAPALTAAAALCTDFGRVRDLDELTRLLARAAELMQASGVVVWLGNAAGVNLRPVLAHGYTAQALARMATVPRSADNAAAAAYRTGTLQVVTARPGSQGGAIVAPLQSSDGTIGALSAEIRGGSESSKSVQALATLFAAHLAGVLAATAAEPGETKTAVS